MFNKYIYIITGIIFLLIFYIHSLYNNLLPVFKITNNGIPILMYHYFYKSNRINNNNYMNIKNFDIQMKYLIDNNYYFPTWNELEAYIEGKIVLPSKSIIITIDDAHSSLFSLVYPVLLKYQIPITSFIITSYKNPNKYNIDDRIINFQSHSHNMHRGGCNRGHGGIMQCIKYKVGYNDLIKSIDIIGRSDVFSYPFGDYNSYTIKLVKDAGFKMAVTTRYGKVKVGANKYALPRVRMQGYYNLNDFIKRIE